MTSRDPILGWYNVADEVAGAVWRDSRTSRDRRIKGVR